MCLYTNEKKPRIAQHDLNVLKVIYKDGSVYRTAGFDCILSETPELNEFEVFDAPSFISGKKYRVEGGAIHAFVSQTAANEYVADKNYYSLRAHGDCFIIKGIVPKGTEYFLSETGEEIAAKKILFEPKYLPIENRFDNLMKKMFNGLLGTVFVRKENEK